MASSTRNGRNGDRPSNGRRPSEDRYTADRKRGGDDRYASDRRRGADDRYGSDRRRSSDDRYGSDRRRPSDDRYASDRRRPSDDRYSGDRRRGAEERYGSDRKRGGDDRYPAEGRRSSDRYGDDRRSNRYYEDDRYGSGQDRRRGNDQRRRSRKTRRVVLFTVEILALVVLGVVLWGVMKQTSMQKINVNEEEIKVNMNEGVEENEVLKGYRNIALFGIDSRTDDLGKGNRSDTIMVASINQDTGEVKLVSVYRDTYMNLGNDKYNKCNAAYAAGGPEQAILMLNSNLDLNITDYVSVGFKGLIEAIDSLGGVQIDVKQEEIRHLNNYQASMFSTESKEKLTDDYVEVTQPGLQTLNGMQATAYCRIRATAGDDFRRAERQRTVLLACLDKAKTASLSTLNSTLDKVLPNVQTNLDTSEMLEVLADLAKYKVVANDGFPFEDSRDTGKISVGSVVIPLNLETNVVKLHNFLFEQEEYTPSEQVKSYSARISNDTGR